ncbi:MAG: LysR substrate-binding domain-containing protein [Nocardioidaceae bacterium]
MALPHGTPELADLDLLLSVARLGSLGKAAREHGLSQPAASARIQLVERRLGLRLLDRSPSGSRLTPAGATVTQWARAVVDAAAELLAGAVALRNAEQGWLRVAASMTVAEYLVPRWLVAFRARLPDVTVALRAINSSGVIEMVNAGHVDVGFVEDPATHADLSERVVGRDELAVVVAPSHPWARRRDPLTRGQLSAGRLVLRERGSGTRETLRRVLGDLHDEVPHLEFTSTTAIKEAVTAGAGAAVLSVLAVERELHEGQLLRIPVDGVELNRQLRAVWQKNAALAGAAETLLEIAGSGAIAG